MTDNLPARRNVDLLAVAQQADAVKTLGSTLLASGLLPNAIKKPEAAVAIVLRGNELGIGPMQALDSISVIQGNPTLSSELMRALVQRAGHKFRVREETDQRCTVEGIRRDDPEFSQRVTFSMEDAKRAGVSGKDNWKKHPRAMLLARATSALCRAMFADVIAGCSYVPEEMGAEVDSDGAVISPEPADEARHQAPVESSREEPANEQVEEAEVVGEHSPGGGILPSQKARIEWLSRDLWGNPRAVEEKVLKGVPLEDLTPELAATCIHGLMKTHEKKEAEERQDAQIAEEYVEESVPDSEPAPSGYAHDEQIELIEELAEKLYGDMRKFATGVEYLQDEILKHPIAALSKTEAKQLIDRMRSEQREGASA